MNTLPSKFKKYFWDCDFSKLDLINHRSYIMNRFLTLSDLSVIRFVFDLFSRNEVMEYLATKGKKSLSKKNYLFWQKLVKHEELWKK